MLQEKCFRSSALLLLVVFSLLWMMSIPLKNTSIVDSFWGAGFIIIAFNAFTCSNVFHFPPTYERSLLLLLLLLIWGSRLSLYILWRNWGMGEDYRYKSLRRSIGKHYWFFSYLIVFLLQAITLLVISMPILNVILYRNAYDREMEQVTMIDILGVLLWTIGMIFETGGDLQLAMFKANPKNKGKLLTSGLWSLSRHPNYFGDALIWWSFYIININVPNGWFLVFSPLLMTFLLLRVSGIPLTEARLTKQKPNYDRYVKNTSAFFPGGSIVQSQQ